MIRSQFDTEAVADAVAVWMPGYHVSGGPEPKPAVRGDRVSYRLRCTRNELIDDFDVRVAVVTSDEGEVAVSDSRGNTVKRPIAFGGTGPAGLIDGSGLVPMAVEEIPTSAGPRQCTVSVHRGRIPCLVWVSDGVAYRTIHDAGGFRMCLDLVGTTLM